MICEASSGLSHPQGRIPNRATTAPVGRYTGGLKKIQLQTPEYLQPGEEEAVCILIVNDLNFLIAESSDFSGLALCWFPVPWLDRHARGHHHLPSAEDHGWRPVLLCWRPGQGNVLPSVSKRAVWVCIDIFVEVSLSSYI